MRDYITANWQELLTFVGVGGGSGLLGKIVVDKQQNKKIKSLEKRVGTVESDLKLNTVLDEQFRETIKGDLTDIKGQNKMILKHLLDNK